MPRRHTSSAAGALAAAILTAFSVPALAQVAPAPPPLRGSIEVQSPDVVFPSRASRRRDAAGQDADRQDGDRQDGQQQGGSGADALRGPTSQDRVIDRRLGVETPNDLAEDSSFIPGAPGPLGGLGDEEEERERDVPGPGITTASGLPLIERPRLNDVLDNRPLLPQGHNLDPYVPIGMKLGSFLLFTEAEVGMIATDNVLALQIDPQSDVAFEFAPTVQLVSNWARHEFIASFDADRSWYKDFPIEDDKTYAALLRGRLDLTRRTNVALELGKSQTQAGRNSVSLTNFAGINTTEQEEHIAASVGHTFNRLTVEAEGRVSRYDFEDIGGLAVVDPVLGRIVPPQDIRDYREDELILRGSYELQPDLSVFVEGEISQEFYRQPVRFDGITRDSNGYAVLGGARFAFSDALFGEFSLGWGEQTSIAEDVGAIQGILLNADIIWRPTPMTMVEFLARSEVNPAEIVDSLGAIDRFYELSIQHAFWRFLVIGGAISYEVADYAATPQVDERIRERVTAEYYFNPYMSVYGRFEHIDFFSTGGFGDYTENEVRVGMRLRH